MPIAKLRSIVLDCPDPAALADFYAKVLGGRIKADKGGDWIDVVVDGSVKVSFQRAPGFVPPSWPRPDASQQLHLDLDVDDMEEGQKRVLALGATALDLDDGGGKRDFRVFADPAGHPFCLIRS
ncbi:VOC family protein [Streptomyces sp. NPDC003077]|uniref:VOC family protein n=1 Tax=Streptomyces sp. NPDC003077 TaxID=3154443 RepID=UPI0033AC576C